MTVNLIRKFFGAAINIVRIVSGVLAAMMIFLMVAIVLLVIYIIKSSKDEIISKNLLELTETTWMQSELGAKISGTLANKTKGDVKDIIFECSQYAKSGTYLGSISSSVVYKIFPSDTSEIPVEFEIQSNPKADSYRCKVKDWEIYSKPHLPCSVKWNSGCPLPIPLQ